MSYDPTVGRWTAEDPIAFEGGDANLYRYVGNEPTDFVDPTGLDKTSKDFADGLEELINDLFTPRPTITPPPAPPGTKVGINDPIGPFGQSPTGNTRPGILGPIPVLTPGNGLSPGKPPGTPVAPPSASTNIALLPTPKPPPIGVTGATPCAGVILIPKDPNDKNRPYKAYHFGPLDDPTNTLRGTNPYAIPAWGDPGYTALITGAAGNTPDSLTSLQNAIRACRSQNIPIKGYVPSTSVVVDPNTGKIYDTEPPGFPH
jgi:hypothetical protein